MDNKLLLNKFKSKTSSNVNNSLTLEMVNGKKILPVDPMFTTISAADVYNQERQNCKILRYTAAIDVIGSNVLFNNITEIVKDEGSSGVTCLNYSDIDSGMSQNIKYKSINYFQGDDRSDNAIRDTQISNIQCGYNYHCGVNIFNNHILRSQTFKTVYPSSKTKDDNFNTIKDVLRDEMNPNGKQGYKTIYSTNYFGDLHLYLNEEILSFQDCYDAKLVEKDGWFGFINQSKLPIDKGLDSNDYFKVINNRKQCDFIDLCPERELFYFVPKYNPFRKRIEKNWEYCLTYPSSSTTDISFIKEIKENDEIKGSNLKIFNFDDRITNLNGTAAIQIWSISKHGLSQGNMINIYNDNECVIQNATVSQIIDDYTFYATISTPLTNSTEWAKVNALPNINNKNYKWIKENKILSIDGKITKYAVGNSICLNETYTDLSFTRVVEGVESKYYIRLFSKLPNWKYAQEKPTEKNVQKLLNNEKTVFDFENHIGKMAFSRNIYNDTVGELVYTDDINFDLLKDNLGRPLSTIYLTLIKNNAGYREWYGKNNKAATDISLSGDTIEYSHVFGKVTSAFELSQESLLDSTHRNIFSTNNSRNGTALNTKKIASIDSLDNDEINVQQEAFYGDLCCYSPNMCDEQIIQDVQFRFNTAQRELTSADKAYNFFNKFSYDEIISDDFDANNFKIQENAIAFLTRNEGYYYKPHYAIPIRAYSRVITSEYPNFMRATNITINTDGSYQFKSFTYHFLVEGNIFNAYDKKNHQLLYCQVTEVISSKMMNIKVYNDTELRNSINLDINDLDNYKFFVKPLEIPSYAIFLTDGTCRYIWRVLYENGFSPNEDVETYPFTNGALYISQNIKLYLHRQDPSNTSDLRATSWPYGITKNGLTFEQEDNYYQEDEITC